MAKRKTKEIKCCTHCGRDTPNKSAICKFCTSGSELHKECRYCKQYDCKCPEMLLKRFTVETKHHD